MEPPKCEHHWVSQHQPGHEVYWVLVCSICHEPNWDELDKAILEERNRSSAIRNKIVAYHIFGDFYDPKDVTIIRMGTEIVRFGPPEDQPTRSEMPSINMIEKFKEIVFEYAMTHLDKTDENSANKFFPQDVYVVWQCKALQNWKALLSTALLDGMYYELTYNGDKNEIYLDAYKKFENMRIPLPPGPGSGLENLEALRQDWARTE